MKKLNPVSSVPFRSQTYVEVDLGPGGGGASTRSLVRLFDRSFVYSLDLKRGALKTEEVYGYSRGGGAHGPDVGGVPVHYVKCGGAHCPDVWL